MSRTVIYRNDFKENKKKYSELCRLYIIKNKLETIEDIKNWNQNKLIITAHKYHQKKILKNSEPIKLNTKCKNFCEGWYTSDRKCACGEKNVKIKNVNLTYLNFTILDSKHSGYIVCY